MSKTFIGNVKSVLSGDTLILTSPNNPAAERIFSLAYVSAPHLKREGDEPFAFQSREYLRNLVVGKPIQCTVLYTIPTTGKEFGSAQLKDGTLLPDELIKAGWLKVREDAGRKEESEELLEKLEKLRALESEAKGASKGLWSGVNGTIEVQNDLGGPEFLTEWKGKTVDGIVERVLSGDRLLVRLLLSEKKHVQPLTLVAGIRTPSTERTLPSTGATQPAEEFGNESPSIFHLPIFHRRVPCRRKQEFVCLSAAFFSAFSVVCRRLTLFRFSSQIIITIVTMRTAVALSVAAVAQASTFQIGTIHENSAPVLSTVEANAIPDAYIIKFKDHVGEAQAEKHHDWLQSVHSSGEQERLELRKRSSIFGSDDVFDGLKHTFKMDGFKGYAGHFHESTIEQVRNHPDVEYIERDSIVHTMLPLESKDNIIIEDSCSPETEKQAPWGLARISHRDTLNFGSFNKYLYTAEGGEGVDAYIIDTGTNIEHVDFEGRAKWGKTIPAGDEDEDGNGHGTHCSGTVAGKKYGVAKKAHVYAVKVLRSNGSGTMSDVVKGVEFAAISHQEAVKQAKDGKRKGFKGSVANMSLGGGKTSALDAAVNAAVKAGIHFAVAAGNDNADACNYSPAAASEPVTVGASALDDSRAYFSNYGKCTDIFAPGLSIQSTWIGSKYAVNTISGTSMASPHIAGLLAYYLSLQPATDSEFAVAPITPNKLKKDIISVATVGTLSDIPADTPNKLAWNGAGCSNYSQIIEAGSYTAKPKANKAKLPATIEELEEAIEGDFEVVSGKIVKGAKTFGSKAEKFAKKIHDLVEEEIEEFISELSE